MSKIELVTSSMDEKNQSILFKLRQLFVLSVVLVISPCTSRTVGYDKISQLYERIESVFLENNANELNRMREAFFPSTLSHYWQADGIEIIDIEVCLKINNTSSLYSCNNWYEERATVDKMDSFTECWVFRWTNSYLLNLINVKQLFHFEPVTTSALFGTIAKTHWIRLINFTLTLPCDALLSSMDNKMIQQSFIRFLSWSKAYVIFQGLPSNWDNEYQGFVTRKYEYAAVDLQKIHKPTYYSTLICYILCNSLVLYIMLRNSRTIYKKLSQAVNQSERFGRSIIKGFITFVAMLLAPAYICYITIIHVKNSPYTPVCSYGHYYGCIPAHDIYVLREQEISFISKTVVVSIMIPTYFIAAIYIIKRTEVRRVFSQKHYSRCVEVYLLWGLLVCVHIGIGLASLPLLIFMILIPTYTLFYLSCWIICLPLLSLPVAALYQMCRVKWHTADRYTLLRICDFLLVYTLATGILFITFFLYFQFLDIGARMNSIKGLIFSLLPPILISIAAFVIKRRVFPKQNLRMEADLNERQPLLPVTSSHIIKSKHLNGHGITY